MDADRPYLLLTPGPLSTTRSVRRAMLRDHSTWDADYHAIVQRIRRRLVDLAGGGDASAVLMPGSGTFSVEAVLGSAVPRDGRLLVVSNGAYGRRMVELADRLGIDRVEVAHADTEPPDLARVEAALADPAVTHVAMVHCETTTGLLNPAQAVGALARRRGASYVLDAMSSFGGIPLSLAETGADFLVSSPNKCLQGVPGFGLVIARRAALEAIRGRARSLSLDLYDQWQEMERGGGKWRFTSPTHAVAALDRALEELDEEGGPPARQRRYLANQRRLVEGMEKLGFRALLPRELQSPIVTSFLYPGDPRFDFPAFYGALKARRFVLYPGKVSTADCFPVGSIGDVHPEDIEELLVRVAEVSRELGLRLP